MVAIGSDSGLYIDVLADLIYSPQTMEAANNYLRSRGIDPAKMPAPCAWTPPGSYPYECIGHLYPPYIFEECFYMPVLEMLQPGGPPVLAGLDTRYLGNSPQRTRYQKLKRSPDTVLMYNFQDLIAHPEWPTMVFEGVLDAESVRQRGFPINCISPLTAMAHERFVAFLHAACLGPIFVCYDNDASGKSALSKILETAALDDTVLHQFNTFRYPGKDINALLMERGPSRRAVIS